MQLTLRLPTDRWEREWKQRLPVHRGSNGPCGPLDVCARADPGQMELEVSCLRCAWSNGAGGHMSQGFGAPELSEAAARALLPRSVAGEHFGMWTEATCEPGPDWMGAVSALWRKAFGAAMEGVSWAAVAPCRRLAWKVRVVAYRAAEADDSGRVIQLVEAQPVVAAVVAWAAARGGGRRAWEPVVEGRPLREVLRHAARSLGRDRPEQLRRLRWLVRNLPSDASPRHIMDATVLPLVHTDVPAKAEDRLLWLEAMGRAGAALAAVGDPAIRDGIGRYVSRHFGFFDPLIGVVFEWSDLVDWMVETGRRPGRGQDPRTLVFQWAEAGLEPCRRQDAIAEVEALERTGVDTLPAPPWPAFEDGDFEVRPLTRVRDLLAETVEMDHCIYHFHNRLRTGSCAAYSVRAGAHRATLMIARDVQGDWRIRELAGRSNRPPAPSLKARVERWAALESGPEGASKEPRAELG